MNEKENGKNTLVIFNFYLHLHSIMIILSNVHHVRIICSELRHCDQ